MRIQDLTILVVDDVNAMRVEIQGLLREFGFENFKLAANGAEAKAILESEEIDFVLADWHMTPMNGVELLEYIRRNPNLRSIPFVMVTAECTKEKVLEAVRLGVDEYIMKPLTAEQIQSKVFNLLVKKKVLL